MKYINSDYVPKGDLEDFPLEVIDKMIERQVEQGNKTDVSVFEIENESNSLLGGFWWHKTIEGKSFWDKVILERKFDIFFDKYPKEKELPLPRVIMVRNDEDENWARRVVFMFKNNKAICWLNAETLEQAEQIYQTATWSNWREVQDEPKLEYKPFDFSDGIVNHLDLLGKKIISKDDDYAFIINKINFNATCGKSFIGWNDSKYIFENYTFEDGSPVGVKI